MAQMADAGRRIADGQDWSPRPRDEVATRIRQFVAMCDRERVWDMAAAGDSTRAKALTVADVLDQQAARTR